MALNPVLEQQRQRIQQGAQAAGQQQTEALQRRFAAMGGGPGSGAMEKIQGQQQEALNRNTNEAMGGVDAQQQQLDEKEKERSFAAEEAQKGRTQQQGQFEANLGFQSKQFDFNKSSKLRELDQMDKKFNLDRELGYANIDMEKEKARKSGGLLGGGGFLGLGIGN